MNGHKRDVSAIDEDSRAIVNNEFIEEINKGKLSEEPLHVLFNKFKFTEEDKQRMKNIDIKRGKFTENEDIILTKNWHQFCDDFPVDNPHLVLGFFHQNNLDEKKATKELIKRSEMYRRLARGLSNRTIHCVYQRARKLFSGLRKSKNLTEEERKEIIELGLQGYKGVDIASRIFADIRTVDEVLRRNINNNQKRIIKKNKWSEEDDLKMVRIIRQLTEEWDPPLINCDTHVIPWKRVADLMGNRSDHQCRDHFHSTKFFQTYNETDASKKWSKRYSRRLVYYLNIRDFKNESDIDWDEIKDVFPEHRFCTIRRSWTRIRSKIEDNESLQYPKLIQRLYSHYVEPLSQKKIAELEQFFISE